MLLSHFYIELGKMLYALANSDGIILDRERAAISRIITDELQKHDKTFGKEIKEKEVLLAKVSFETSARNGMSIKEGLQSFTDFLKNHGEKIDNDPKKFALHLIRKVASSSGGISKNEGKAIAEIEKYLSE